MDTMDHQQLRESETQYERAMNRDIKECDNHMKKRKREKKIEIRRNFY
jgi:hypothetical protein